MGSKIILYYMPVSPPSRAVVLVAKAINIDLDLRQIDVSRGEQMTPEFLKVTNYAIEVKFSMASTPCTLIVDQSSTYITSS